MRIRHGSLCNVRSASFSQKPARFARWWSGGPANDRERQVMFPREFTKVQKQSRIGSKSLVLGPSWAQLQAWNTLIPVEGTGSFQVLPTVGSKIIYGSSQTGRQINFRFPAQQLACLPDVRRALLWII